jgi:phosphoglycerol transferase MdoB-like AlkP superfamily enzyme
MGRLPEAFEMYIGCEVGSAGLVSGFDWAKFQLVIRPIIMANTSTVAFSFVLGGMFWVNWQVFNAVVVIMCDCYKRMSVWYLSPTLSLLHNDNCGSFTLKE